MNIQALHISRYMREPIVKGMVLTAAGMPISVFRLEPLSPDSRFREAGWGYYLPQGDISAKGGCLTDIYWLDSETFRCARVLVTRADTKKALPKVSSSNRTLLKELVRLAGNKTLKFNFARERAATLMGVSLAPRDCKSWPTLVQAIETHLYGAKK